MPEDFTRPDRERTPMTTERYRYELTVRVHGETTLTRCVDARDEAEARAVDIIDVYETEDGILQVPDGDDWLDIEVLSVTRKEVVPGTRDIYHPVVLHDLVTLADQFAESDPHLRMYLNRMCHSMTQLVNGNATRLKQGFDGQPDHPYRTLHATVAQAINRWRELGIKVAFEALPKDTDELRKERI